MQVIFKQLMKESSGRQRGTLMQLRNLIKATAIPKYPKQNFKATEDFLLRRICCCSQGCHEKQWRDRYSSRSFRAHCWWVCLIAECTNWKWWIGCCTNILVGDNDTVFIAGGFSRCHKRGVGDKLMMLWKFMLIVFDAGNRYNYRKKRLFCCFSAITFFAT